MERTPQTPEVSGVREVLVVEDDDTIRDIIARWIEDTLEYPVISTGDGFEALQLARQHSERINLITLDINLPSLSGLEILEALAKEALAPKAVLMCTGVQYLDTVRRIFRIEAPSIIPVDYLLKPFDVDDLAGGIALATKMLRKRYLA